MGYKNQSVYAVEGNNHWFFSHINTVFVQNIEFVSVKLVVYVVTTEL